MVEDPVVAVFLTERELRVCHVALAKWESDLRNFCGATEHEINLSVGYAAKHALESAADQYDVDLARAA